MSLEIFADGACWGNPGPAAIGAVLKNEQQEAVVRISEYIGHGTNNRAEYRAVIAALKAAAALGESEVVLYLDSELLVKQLNGVYKVRNNNLRPLYNEAIGLIKRFQNISINHIRRGNNVEADALANAALEKRRSGK